MALAKTADASNMMQDLVKATHIATTKAVWIAIFHCSIIVSEENWISS